MRDTPLKYTDPDGDVWWLAPVIMAAVWGTGNTVAQAMAGNIDNFWDGVKYFGQGAVTGFALGCAWQFAPLIPFVGQGIQTTMTVYGLTQTTIGAVGTAAGIINGWESAGNGYKLFLGNFYLDENNWLGGIANGILRHTWEMPQSVIGQGYSQGRNAFGRVDRVDYFGGATFATRENAGFSNGVTLGNYINININYKISGNFRKHLLNAPLYMHEYGHTIDSRTFGLSYLFAIGIPSIISADCSKLIKEWDGKEVENLAKLKTHDVYWSETRANKQAAKYFKKYFGVDWEKHPDYPLSNPFK